MRIAFEDIESPSCCLLTLGSFTLVFDTRAEADNFLLFLQGHIDAATLLCDALPPSGQDD